MYLRHVNRHKASTNTYRFNQFDCPDCSKSHDTVTELRKHLMKEHVVTLSLMTQINTDPVPSTSEGPLPKQRRNETLEVNFMEDNAGGVQAEDSTVVNGLLKSCLLEIGCFPLYVVFFLVDYHYEYSII